MYIETESQSELFDRGNLLQLYSCFSWFICKHKAEKIISSQSDKSRVNCAFLSPVSHSLSLSLSLSTEYKCMFCNSNHGDIGINISISGSSISSRCLQRIWLNWMWCWFLVFLRFNNCSFLHSPSLSLSLSMRALCYDFSHSDQLYLFIYCFILLHVSFVVSFAFHMYV